LTVAQFGALLKEVGLNIVAADTRHLMHRIDSNGNGRMSREEFLSFVQLNDDQLDEVALKIRDFFGATKGASKKKVLKAIRQRFKRLDSDGDGILDIEEFKLMVQMVGIFLTEPELMRLRRVFDPDGDGMIGKEEFESVVLGMDDTVKRQCIRVCDATQALRDYILQCQRELRKKGSKDGIDSESAWLDLERKHKRGVGGTPFPGYLDLEDVAQAVERLGFRLSQPESRMLIMRVAPDGDGRVSNVEFHEFATEPKPRPIGELVGIMGKNRDALMAELMSPKLKGSKLRRYINRIVTAIGPDDVGLVTFEVLANGLSTFFNYRERAGQPTDGELVSISQYLGAVDVRFFMVDPRLFVVGLRSECTGDEVADLVKLFEDEDEGAVYSDLLTKKKRSRGRSYFEEDDDDDDDVDEDEDEYEWIEVEVEEEVEKDDKVFDVCMELCDYFKEVSEVEGSKGKFDYELALNSIQEDRESGSLMDIENDFSGWLNELGEMEALSDDEFGVVLERFDPKNTNLVGAKQIEAFCNGDTWSMEKEMEVVTKTEKKKVKKKKTKTKKNKTKRSASPKKKKKGRRVEDSDEEEEDSFDFSNEEEEEDEEEDMDGSDEEATDDDDDGDDDFYGRSSPRRKSGRKKRRDEDDDDDEDDDFISSPLRRRSGGSSKSITGNTESDMLVRDIAKVLGAKHRDLGSGLEQMVRLDFRKMDVFGNGLLRPEEINLGLRGLGYRKQVNSSSPGLKFFLDRGGNVDFNGLAQAIGQASWERDHSNGGGSVTGTKKLDNKVRTLAEDLKEVTKKMDKVLGKLSRSDGSLGRSDFKRGMEKLVNETEGDLTERETKMFFSALNRECGGDGGEKSINLSDFRHFVKTSGDMLFSGSSAYLGSREIDGFDDDDAMDSDFQQALDRCTEEFEDMDLTKRNRRKVRNWFENVDKAGKGTVSAKAFQSFLKKSKIGNNLSRREKDCLVKGLESGSRGKVDYETFIERVVDGKGGEGGRLTADAALAKMQEAVNNSVRNGGGSYAMIFSRYDPSGSGVVTKDGMVGAFRSIGCYLNDEEVNVVSKKLKSRGDGMLDYNDLYQLLLQTTPRVGGGVGYGGMATPFSAIAGGTMTPWGTAGRGALGMSMGGGGALGGTPWRGGAAELGQTWPPPGESGASLGEGWRLEKEHDAALLRLTSFN
jgi:Ca2+-binding EF-hand superfamily protein